MELKLLLLLVQKGERMMESWIDLSSLSNSELTALEQQILQEQSRRVMNDPELIVVEPDASEESHREALAKLLQRKKQ
ncbi:hypothetical protein [Scytonema millei]|uniref:Uncharacterized protein n=1 Tax=Scytonema millei VB511283 TaxID=1245923 RepID=A0A9X5I727_9CYAN|nr:hypothetical protein [Scytonema millei]NHC37665.1 hypothetical protein [Scytonema millei VB511283]